MPHRSAKVRYGVNLQAEPQIVPSRMSFSATQQLPFRLPYWPVLGTTDIPAVKTPLLSAPTPFLFLNCFDLHDVCACVFCLTAVDI